MDADGWNRRVSNTVPLDGVTDSNGRFPLTFFPSDRRWRDWPRSSPASTAMAGRH